MSWVIEPRAGGGLARAPAAIVASPDATPAMAPMVLNVLPATPRNVPAPAIAPIPVATSAPPPSTHPTVFHALLLAPPQPPTPESTTPPTTPEHRKNPDNG